MRPTYRWLFPPFVQPRNYDLTLANWQTIGNIDLKLETRASVKAFLLQQPRQGSPRLQMLNGLATKVKTNFVSRSEAETSQVSHELSVAEPSPIELKPSPIELAFKETFETSLQL